MTKHPGKSPEGIKSLLGRDSQPCSMGVGCDEYGVCYADAHGRSEMCPAQSLAKPAFGKTMAAVLGEVG